MRVRGQQVLLALDVSGCFSLVPSMSMVFLADAGVPGGHDSMLQLLPRERLPVFKAALRQDLKHFANETLVNRIRQLQRVRTGNAWGARYFRKSCRIRLTDHNVLSCF